MATMTKTIEGMSCGNCVRHVTEAIQGVPGVKSVDVSLEGKSAAIQFDWQIDEVALRKAVEDAGYRVA